MSSYDDRWTTADLILQVEWVTFKALLLDMTEEGSKGRKKLINVHITIHPIFIVFQEKLNK
jgi:hypothetical protein